MLLKLWEKCVSFIELCMKWQLLPPLKGNNSYKTYYFGINSEMYTKDDFTKGACRWAIFFKLAYSFVF